MLGPHWLEIKNLTKVFHDQKGEIKALDDISFSVYEGEFVSIVGPSGCGKTTLGRTILKLYDSNGGTIKFNGEDITNYSKKEMIKLRTKMQLIFQLRV